MAYYRIQFSYLENGSRIQAEDTFWAENEQKAVDQLREEHSGLLWNHEDVRIREVRKLHYWHNKYLLAGFTTTCWNWH